MTGSKPPAQRREDRARAVRLMSDYMCGVPLWGSRGCLNGSRAELGLSAELYDDLLEWQRTFERGFRWDRGWVSFAEREAYAAAAPQLLRRLRAELPDREVRVDLWPLDDDLTEEA